jgi:4a-hydroxytetrahydrobiopterin dehydratase
LLTKWEELQKMKVIIPDISFGWGYAEIKITTHAIEGLSENDFILAAKIDHLTNV